MSPQFSSEQSSPKLTKRIALQTTWDSCHIAIRSSQSVSRVLLQLSSRSNDNIKLTYLFTVGRPISVQQKDHPTDAELDEVQARYIAELKRCVRCPPPVRARLLSLTRTLFDRNSIWENYKEIYAKSRTRELTIIA